MPVLDRADQPREMLSLLEYTQEKDLRAGMLLMLLDLPKAGYGLEVERHGIMSSLAIFRGDDWCFSAKPALKWIKVWVRNPELALHHITRDRMAHLFPSVAVTKQGEVTARLYSFQQCIDFCDLLVESA